jgi:PIN domain nuclease of toxin-antitoxin system
MRLLLDTHVFLWCLNDDRQLSNKARSMIQSATEVYVSSASIWEASIKMKIGKLNVNLDSLVTSIADSGFLELPISAAHAAYTYHLPDIHKDPFDRMLIAQSILEPLRLVTADKVLKDYSDLVEFI